MGADRSAELEKGRLDVRNVLAVAFADQLARWQAGQT